MVGGKSAVTTGQLAFGDEVVIPWGVDEVHGTVHEVYGEAPKIYVVIQLTPELSGYVVDEPTTVTLPIDAVKRAVSAT